MEITLKDKYDVFKFKVLCEIRWATKRRPSPLWASCLLLLSLWVFVLHQSVLVSSDPLSTLSDRPVCVRVSAWTCVSVFFNDDLIALLSSSSPPQQLSKLHQLAMQQTPFTPLGQTTPAFTGTYPPTRRPSLPKLLLSFLPVETNTFSSSFISLSLLFLSLSFLFSSSRRSPPNGLCGALPLTWPAGGLLLLMLRFLLFFGFPLVSVLYNDVLDCFSPLRG